MAVRHEPSAPFTSGIPLAMIVVSDEDVMPTTVEISPEQVEALDRIAAREHTSRDALVRRLVAEFVAESAVQSGVDRFFGLWVGRAIDGLDHQERLRSEW